MADEVGEHNRDFGNFDARAKTTEGFVRNKDLNPRPQSWKQKLVKVAGGALAATGLIIGGKETYENVSASPEFFGEPYGDGVPIVTDLIKVEDNMQELIEPTYRSEPTTGGKELSEEELQERGFHPEIKEGVIIQEVKGGTYAGNPLHGKGRIVEDGDAYGVWGEILMPKIGGNIGEYTRTGIFVSENFIDQEDSEKITLDNDAKPQIFEREKE